jgi:hypothetical protein
MLGSPCSPCCGSSCSAAFSYIAARTPTVTISGSAPGQSAATIATAWPNATESNKTTQQNPYVIIGEAAPDFPPFFTRWRAKTQAEQETFLNSRNVYGCYYYRAGSSADGTHELSLDLSGTTSTSSGGTALFRKATADYLITLRIVLGGAGTQTLPGVSCGFSATLNLIQYAYVKDGAFVPALSTVVKNVTYSDFRQGYDTISITAGSVLRWPQSEYVQLLPGKTPDGDGKYDPGDLQHLWEADLSAANVSVRNVGGVVVPSTASPVVWDTVAPYQAVNFNNATPAELVSDSGGVASYSMAGFLVAAGGAWRWSSGAGSLRNSLTGDMITMQQDATYIQGFFARTSLPQQSSRSFARQSISSFNVVANIPHP